ncbi:MAG TPA: membrane protein insertase YidC [bacterium]|jgi:YidC/Oxa1 family membrane protein insertase|nr:membrane protein insertase YidC [bacterium]
MNRNVVIFILASLGILLLWQRVVDHYAPLPVPAASAPGSAGHSSAAPSASASAAPASAASAAAFSASAVPSLSPSKEQIVTVETGAFEAELSSQGAKFSSLKLKGIKKMGTEGNGTLDLVPPADEPRYGALELEGTNLDSMAWTVLTPKPLDEGGKQVVRFGASVGKTGLKVVKTFSFDPAGSMIHVQIAVHNGGAALSSFPAPLSLLWGPDLGGDGGGMNRGPLRTGVVQLSESLERVVSGKNPQTLDYAAPRWLALKNHYFVVGIFPAAGSAWTRAEVRADQHVTVALQAEGLSVAPGQTLVLDADLWAGPQEYTALKAVGNNFQGVLQFSYASWLEWLNPACVVLLLILKWFHMVTGNWGVAVILLTLLVRGALFYPSMKSMVSMRKMQKKQALLKPRLDTLKKTYKDNPKRLNEETMKLYQEFGVNPLGGCLPMLIQFPVFFALYDTFAAAYELRGAGFIWRWTDLTAPDPTYIFPIAMGLSMFLQQRMTPAAAAASEDQQQMQKMMQWMMPIMFTGMALYLHWPLGLLLYWTASNAMGVLQQVVVNKLLVD